MDLFLTGGTGVVGRPLLTLLTASGHRVRVVTRSEDKAAAVEAAGGLPVRLPEYEVDHLAEAMRGCDAVVDLTTSVPALHRAARRRAWRQHDWLRDQGTARVVAAATAAGVPRLVRDSVTFLHADGGERWIDESWPLDPGAHLASAQAAEQHVARFGGEAVVLRLALLYGPESAQTRATARLARRLGVAAVLGPPHAYLASLHTHDAASAVSASLTAPPGTYDISDGDPLTRLEVADALARALGRGRLRLPPGLLVRGAPAASQTRSHRLTAERFRAATGWTPQWSSLRQGLTGVVAEWEAPRAA